MDRKDTPPAPIGLEEFKRHAEALFKFETSSKKPTEPPSVSSLAALASAPSAQTPAEPEAPKVISITAAKKKKRD